MRKAAFVIVLFLSSPSVFAQRIDLLIKGGHVIDPKNQVDGIFDVGVSRGKIILIAKTLEATNAAKVIDASGMYVVPGLIDIHTHDFYGPDSTRNYCGGNKSVLPDAFSFRSGVTTVVDAGSSGWRDFPVFKKAIIDHSKTRVLAFLNIVGGGMRGSHFEQDSFDMNGSRTAAEAKLYPACIVGIKLAHYQGHGWKAVNESMIAGNLSHLPVMIDFGENSVPMSIRELFLDHMRPGDIFTHCFAELKGRECIVDTGSKKLKSFVWDARKKGVCFDVGYGAISFSFAQALPAVRQGFYPNTISTDMHAVPNLKLANMQKIMSEFLSMGMPLLEVIKSVTWNPAREIHHEELGNISTGAVADIAILRLTNEKVNYYDNSGYSFNGSGKFKTVFTIREGEIVYKSL